MLSFFKNLVKYKIKYEIGVKDLATDAKNIRLQAENLNPVWQKFCQTLSCREDVIGPVLATELQSLLDSCPNHDHNYTNKLISNQLSHRNFLTPFDDKSLIGSGTIGQVYKIYENDLEKWLAIKVKHPNIKQQIGEAHDKYQIVSNSMWFPKNLKICGDEFFKGLYKQEDFSSEYLYGTKMKMLFDKGDVFIIPDMIEHTESIILMGYEAGEYNFVTVPKSKDLIGLIMINIQVISMYNGLIHSDLHWGNFSIRLNPLKIILYDFGLMVDITDRSREFRKKLAKAFLYYDINSIFELLILKANIKNKEKKYHMDNINNKISNLPPETLVSDKMKKILLYCQMNGLLYDELLLSILYACIHCEQIEKMIPKIPCPNDLLLSLPYTEFEIIKKLL